MLCRNIMADALELIAQIIIFLHEVEAVAELGELEQHITYVILIVVEYL